MRTSLTTALIVFVHLLLYSQISETELSGNGICFPQMTTAERDLVTPISGQCIFNIETNRLECYIEAHETWTGIQSLLSDADGDTQVLVEQSPDEDIIHMVANGLDVLTIRASDAGDTRVEPAAYGANNELRGNIFYGAETGHDITTGIDNVVVGVEAAVPLSTGNANTILGRRSGINLNTGHSNTFLGSGSGFGNTAGSLNTYVGMGSGNRVTTGNNNTFLGYGTDGPRNGSSNVFIGSLAGEEIHNANRNVYIGTGAGSDAMEIIIYLLAMMRELISIPVLSWS